ncbi:MAG: hypothetical protein AAF351_08510 [Pseudomonadota bacterium]
MKLATSLYMSLAITSVTLFLTTDVLADSNPPLPESIREMPDKLIKYEHLKGKRASNGKDYDIKIQYGRASKKFPELRSNPRRIIAFTRVLIRRSGTNNDYVKPSADRLSELFPGSFVYASIQASLAEDKGFSRKCSKKRWYRSRKFTTFVSISRLVCNDKGFESGHRARIGNEMLVDGKL